MGVYSLQALFIRPHLSIVPEIMGETNGQTGNFNATQEENLTHISRSFPPPPLKKKKKKKSLGRKQDGREVCECGVYLSPWIHQEYTFKHRSAWRIAAETDRRKEWTVEKNAQNHAKLGRTKELGGKTGVSLGLDLPSPGRGTEAGIRSPHRSNCLSQRRNIKA